MSENLFCPNCGTKLSADDAFCPNCGFNLAEFNAKQNSKPATKPDESKNAQPTKNAKPAAPAQPAPSQGQPAPVQAQQTANGPAQPQAPQSGQPQGPQQPINPAQAPQQPNGQPQMSQQPINPGQPQAPQQPMGAQQPNGQAPGPQPNGPGLPPNGQVQQPGQPMPGQPMQQPNQPGVQNFQQPVQNGNVQANQAPQDFQQPAQGQTQSTTKPSKKKKSHKGLISIIVILVVLIGGYFAGSQMYSRSSQASSLASDLSSGDTSKMANTAVDSDGNALKAKDMEPLSALFLQDNDAKTQVKRIIENSDGSAKAADDSDVSDANFQLVQDGKYLGLFPKYKIQIKTQPIKIYTNANSPSFKIDGKTVSAAKTSNGYKIEDQMPGVYTIELSGDGKTSTKKVTIPLTGTPEFKTMNVSDSNSSDDSEDADSNDNGSDNDVDSNDDNDSDSSDFSRVSSNPQRSDLIGTWYDDNDDYFTFNSDGTYQKAGASGTWTVTGKYNGAIRVKFVDDTNKAGSWTAEFGFTDSDHMSNDNGNNFSR